MSEFERELIKKYPVGSYVHNGFSRMKIVGISIYRAYLFVVRIDPDQSDCIGAWQMNNKVFNVTADATKDFLATGQE